MTDADNANKAVEEKARRSSRVPYTKENIFGFSCGYLVVSRPDGSVDGYIPEKESEAFVNNLCIEAKCVPDFVCSQFDKKDGKLRIWLSWMDKRGREKFAKAFEGTKPEERHGVERDGKCDSGENIVAGLHNASWSKEEEKLFKSCSEWMGDEEHVSFFGRVVMAYVDSPESENGDEGKRWDVFNGVIKGITEESGEKPEHYSTFIDGDRVYVFFSFSKKETAGAFSERLSKEAGRVSLENGGKKEAWFGLCHEHGHVSSRDEDGYTFSVTLVMKLFEKTKAQAASGVLLQTKKSVPFSENGNAGEETGNDKGNCGGSSSEGKVQSCGRFKL